MERNTLEKPLLWIFLLREGTKELEQLFLIPIGKIRKNTIPWLSLVKSCRNPHPQYCGYPLIRGYNKTPSILLIPLIRGEATQRGVPLNSGRGGRAKSRTTEEGFVATQTKIIQIYLFHL
jgi:hypothetical protein